jgi:pyruvate kinase
VLRGLLEAGVSVFRLNMSHSRHDAAAKLIYAARSISTELNRPISLLLDTQGPAIRTGDLPTKLDLKAGDTLTLAVRGHKPEEVFSVDTNYDDLVKDIKVGDVVLVDNGVIQMAVKEKSEFLHPVKCVEVLDRVARRIELSGNIGFQAQINRSLRRWSNNSTATSISAAHGVKSKVTFRWTSIGIQKEW